MKKNLLIAAKLTLVFIVLCSILYPLLIGAAGKLTAGNGNGEVVTVNGKVVGYANIGQQFSADKYFWGRPSAVGYNAAGSGGSNKSATNAEYLKTVQDRLDSFLVHNPAVKKEQVPAELVTASGSGLDPDISPEAAYIQVARVAGARGLPAGKIKTLIDETTRYHVVGPATINVLQLNVALDNLK